MHGVALARNGWIVRMHKGWPPIYSGQLYARHQLVKLTGALHSASKSRVAVLSSPPTLLPLYVYICFTPVPGVIMHVGWMGVVVLVKCSLPQNGVIKLMRLTAECGNRPSSSLHA